MKIYFNLFYVLPYFAEFKLQCLHGFWPSLPNLRRNLIFFPLKCKGGVWSASFNCFKGELYIRGKPILNHDNLSNLRVGLPYLCSKTIQSFWKKRNQCSIWSALTPTTLHERWPKSIQTIPVCGDCNVLFSYNSFLVSISFMYWGLTDLVLNFMVATSSWTPWLLWISLQEFLALEINVPANLVLKLL